MKVALIGPTGFVGSEVLKELLARGHDVVALARDPAKLTARAGLTVVKADAKQADQVAAAVEGADAVVNAFNPGWSVPDIHTEFLEGSRPIYDGVKRAGVKRLIVTHLKPDIDPQQTRKRCASEFEGEVVVAEDLMQLQW